jgi:hypothetical protein
MQIETDATASYRQFAQCLADNSDNFTGIGLQLPANHMACNCHRQDNQFIDDILIQIRQWINQGINDFVQPL